MNAFPFSSKTIGTLAKAIVTSHTASQMGTLFLEAEVDRWEPDRPANKLDRATRLLSNLRADGSDEATAGALELARLVLKLGKLDPLDFFDIEPRAWWVELVAGLGADGLDFIETSDQLLPAVPGVNMPELATWLEAELDRRGWTDAAGHYRQAVDNFDRRNWAAANSQIRSFFEDVVKRSSPHDVGAGPGAMQRAIDHLDDSGDRVLVDGEAEFAKHLWKLLHPRGSHPGLSEQEEATFRLLALTGYSRWLLTRLPS